MTGPEHYREAERLLDNAADAMQKTTREGGTEASAMAVGERITATAQVHATLALVAVTIEVAAEQNGPSGTHQAGLWVAAVSA